ncbi:hypothetical protein AVEN_15562-1, partial [Araneus ventricosus]
MKKRSGFVILSNRWIFNTVVFDFRTLGWGRKLLAQILPWSSDSESKLRSPSPNSTRKPSLSLE